MVTWEDLLADVKEVLGEFKKHKIGLIGVSLITIMVVLGLLAPYMAPGVADEWSPAARRWQSNPRSAPPVWLDWITREDYARHTVVDWDGETQVSDWSYEEPGALEFSYDVLFDDPPPLGEGDVYEGEFIWWTEEGDEGIHDLEVASADHEREVSVTVLEPANFEIEITAPEDGLNVIEGEPVVVEFTVENTGVATGTQMIELRADGEMARSQEVTLEQDEIVETELVWEAEEPGERELSVHSRDDHDEFTINVEEGAYFDVEIEEPLEGHRLVEDESLTVEYVVENTGGEADTQDIEFYVDDDLVDTESNVELEEEEEYEGNFTWTAEGHGDRTLSVNSERGHDEINIYVIERGIFSVDIVDFDEEVGEGEEVTVEYSVDNTGDDLDTQDLEFYVDEELVDSEEVELEGGENFEGEFNWVTEELGEYNLSVRSDDDLDEVTVFVLDEPFFQVEVIDFDEIIYEYDEAMIKYSVTNEGELEVTQEIELTVDQDVVETEEVTLAGGEEYQGEFTWQTERDDAGDYVFGVTSEDSEDEVTVTVSDDRLFSVMITGYDKQVAEGEDVVVEYRVTNTGAEAEIQQVRFLVDGSVEDVSDTWGSNTIEVRHGDNVLGHQELGPASHRIKVSRPPGVENIEVSNFAVSPVDGTAPLEVDITADIAHIGGEEDENRTIELEIPGEPVDYEWELAPGQVESIVAEHTFELDGVYTIRLGDQTQVVTVGVGDDVVVDEFSVEETAALMGSMEAEVRNTHREEERTIRLRIEDDEGIRVAEEEWTIQPGDMKAIEYTHEFTEEGTYHFILGPERASITFEEEEEEEEETLAMHTSDEQTVYEAELELQQEEEDDLEAKLIVDEDEVYLGDIIRVNVEVLNEEREERTISLYLTDELDERLLYEDVVAPAGDIRGYEISFVHDMQADRVPLELFMEYSGYADRYRHRRIEVQRPTEPFEFVGWTGDYEGPEDEITITMDSDKELRAHFGEERYNLRTSTSGNGTIETHPSQFNYERGDEVTLLAKPGENVFDLSMELYEEHLEEGPVAEELSIAFEVQGHALEDDAEIAISNGEWWVLVEGEKEYRIEEDADEGDLNFFELDDWEFSHWIGDYPEGEQFEEEITVEMDKEMNLRAFFKRVDTTVEHELNVNIEGEGAVDIEPEKETYYKGETVVLDAVAAEGWQFDRWSGDLRGTDEEITIVMDEDKDVTATFDDDISYSLDVSTHGEGRVDRSPFRLEYSEGAEVTLTATPEDTLVLEDIDRGDRVGDFHETITVVRRGSIRENLYEQSRRWLRRNTDVREFPSQEDVHPTQILFGQRNENWLEEGDPLKGEYNVTIRVDGIGVEFEEAETTFSGAVFGVFGTDNSRRDLWQGWIWGARYGLYAGGVVALTTIFFSTSFGMTSAYYGGWVDEFMSRINEILMGIPVLPILIIVLRFWSRSINIFVLIYALVMWRGAARVIRARGLQVAKDTYIEASESLGSGSARIIFKHMIPQILPYSIAQAALLVPVVIMAEAGMHILGLGDPTIVTWGTILEDAQSSGAVMNWEESWFWVLFPGVGMVLVGFGFISTGMAIERVINPKMKQR